MSKIKIAVVIALILLGVAVWLQQKCIVSIRQERDRYQLNNDALLADMRRWQIDSTTMAIDVKTLRLTTDEFQKYRAEDAAKIRQMGIKIKSLESAAKYQMEVSAPIAAQLRDSVIIRDTTLVVIKTVSMNTPYIQLSGTIENDSLIGSIRLPVTLCQAVWVDYKRRWLFWKRVNAIHQTVSSDNPHVNIIYSELIGISK